VVAVFHLNIILLVVLGFAVLTAPGKLSGARRLVYDLALHCMLWAVPWFGLVFQIVNV
jgi:hypothetical protein